MALTIATVEIPGTKFRVVEEVSGLNRFSVEVCRYGEGFNDWSEAGAYLTAREAFVAMGREVARVGSTYSR